MKLVKKIDILLIFLLLSVLFLYAFVGDIDYFFRPSTHTRLKTYIKTNSVFKINTINQGIYITNFNPEFNIQYSVDGGQSWKDYHHQNLKSITSNDLTQYTTSIRYKHPFGKMPKVISILIRAKHQTKSLYLKPVPITILANYNSSLPVVSLFCNQVDLISDEKGIMVLGQHSWQDVGFYKAFWFRNANYNQRGNKWRKNIYFQYFEKNNLKYQTQAKLQISGHASRSFPQKSLKIKADRNSGSEQLNYAFFGKKGLKKYKSIVLRNSGNDNQKTLFADVLMHQLIDTNFVNVVSQKGKAVNVFINSNYWGIYNLRERQNRYYIAKKEHCKEDEITILEKANGLLKKGDKKLQQQYVNFIDSIYNLNTISKKTLTQISDNINLNSFTDYIIIETFYGNNDWLMNNTLWYKAGNKKWKWIIVDLDYCLAYNNNNLQKNYFDKLLYSNSITSKLFKTLIKNKTYKSTFKLRAKELIKTLFNKQKVTSTFNKLKNQYKNDISYQINRWRGNFDLEQWNKNCQANLDFLLKRPQIYLKQIETL